MAYANLIMRARYMVRAIDIGSNAVNIVKEFFDGGIEDEVIYTKFRTCIDFHQWTLADLDRALDEMEKAK